MVPTTDGKTNSARILSTTRVPGQAIMDAVTDGIQTRRFKDGAVVALPRVTAQTPYSLRKALTLPGIAVTTAFALASGIATLPSSKAAVAYIQKKLSAWLTGHLGFQMDEVVTPESFYARTLQFFGLTGYLPTIRLQFTAVYQGRQIGWNEPIRLLDLLPCICTVGSDQKFTLVGFLNTLFGSYNLGINFQQFASSLASGQKAIAGMNTAEAIVDESVWAGLTKDQIDGLPMVVVAEPFRSSQDEVIRTDGVAYAYHPGLKKFVRVAVVTNITPASWHVIYVHPKADGQGFTRAILDKIMGLPYFDAGILGLDSNLLVTTLSVEQTLQVRIQMTDAIATVQGNELVKGKLNGIRTQVRGGKVEAASSELDRVTIEGIQDVQTPVESSTLNSGLCAQALVSGTNDAVGVESEWELVGAC